MILLAWCLRVLIFCIRLCNHGRVAVGQSLGFRRFTIENAACLRIAMYCPQRLLLATVYFVGLAKNLYRTSFLLLALK